MVNDLIKRKDNEKLTYKNCKGDTKSRNTREP